MGLKRAILFFISFFLAFHSFAQIEGEIMQSRILILLDESSSMTQSWVSGKPKYKAAHDIIMRLMDSVYAINDHVEFGLRVFGHQHTVPENDCYDTKNEVAFSQDNKNQMYLRLEDIHPLGVTPIAYALKEAAEKDLIDEGHNAYSIILITDGGESCGGDICDVMKKLIKSKVYFKPYIVSLENDPGLKTTYSCMGDLLQVTSDVDIPKAVKTIVDAFRPVLKISKNRYKEIQSTSIPSVLKAGNTVAWKIPAGDIFPEIVPVNPHVNSAKQTAPRVHAIDFPAKLPTVAEAPTNLYSLPIVRTRKLSIGGEGVSTIKQVSIATNLPPASVEAPSITKPEVLARLKPAAYRRFSILFAIDERSYKKIPVPSLPPVKEEKTAIAPKPVQEKKPEYKIEREDNSETTLEVYITNGSGKFYTTNPQVILLDPKTNEAVTKFFRYVGPDGTPDPQTGIAPGIYRLTFASNRAYDQPVTILPNKKNKVIVTVNNTTLSFAYRQAPLAPIKEGWVAVVTERNKTNGRVQEQRMNEVMKYEPGNYHIEVNTFPTTYRNEELDFDFTSEITIDHPGFAKFLATDAKTKSITLYQRMGDKFLAFYTLNLADPRAQHLQIQPGDYQAHFQAGAGIGYAAEKVVVFRIKPNEETTVELK